MSLLTRLTVLLVVSLSPALGFSVYTEFQARHSRERAVESEALRLVRLVSSGQQLIVEGARQMLTVLSGFTGELARDQATCRSRLTTTLQTFHRYSALAILTTDGRTLCGVQLEQDGTLHKGDPGPADRGLVARVVASGAFTVGGYDLATPRPTQFFAEPYRDADGAIAGVIEVGLGLDWLQRQIDALDLPPGSAVSVVGRDGMVLAHRPNPSGFVGRILPPSDTVMLDGDSVRVGRGRGLDGVDRVFGVSPFGVEPVDIGVAVGLDRDLVFPDLTAANRHEAELIVIGAALVGRRHRPGS